ncbi:MAG: hypothetical protein RLY66_355, partial [Candidatus Parcubacteria bacterium]
MQREGVRRRVLPILKKGTDPCITCVGSCCSPLFVGVLPPGVVGLVLRNDSLVALRAQATSDRCRGKDFRS